MGVLLLTADLMLPSQLAGTAAQCGVGFATAASAAALDEALAKAKPRLVLVDLTLRDLDLPAVVRKLKELDPAPSVVAYGPHVQEALLQAARDAGCTEVLARGALHRGFRQLLEHFVIAGDSGH